VNRALTAGELRFDGPLVPVSTATASGQLRACAVVIVRGLLLTDRSRLVLRATAAV